MCGIAGKLYLDNGRAVTEAEVRAMARTLAHRGPDGEGVWANGNIGLAHRRLSIIDLRAVAAQPMCNEDGTVWVAFNGEIYNFRELRADLELRGHIFRTNSDTETIVHAYEEYGRNCVLCLRGMFAFAVWDMRTRTLFLARDRVGKKPLFYFHGRDRFLFGSEVKSILVDETVQVRANHVAIDHFLALQYVPSPLSAFEGIQKLPAAHWLELKDGKVTVERYWKLHYTPKRKLTLHDAIEGLQHHLSEAVRLRLVSDVPIGAFLSGGVDSSAVVAYMAQSINRPVRTFSVGFEDAAFDERPYARQVATRYSTDHTELVVKAPVQTILPRLIWHYDEPFGDSSAVPSYAIAELTRQHVKVVLNGDGGDENFAGYDRYVINRLAHRGDIVPQRLRECLLQAMHRLPVGVRLRRPFRKLVRVAEAMAQPPARRYARWIGHFAPDERAQLYTDDFRLAVAESDPEACFLRTYGQSDAEDWMDATLDTDVNLYLADDLLVKMDRATMAHSLEGRSPLLDHVLMEYVASLPSAFKLHGSEKKYIFKQTLREVLPASILDRPKMGFSAPVRNWFRNELKEMAYDILLSNRSIHRGYFNRGVVQRLLDEHCRAKEDHAEDLWDLLVLELWHRAFVDGEALHAMSDSDTVHVACR